MISIADRRRVAARMDEDLSRGVFGAVGEMERELLALCRRAPQSWMAEGLASVAAAGGKRLRPMLAYLSWSLCGGAGEILPLMVMLELMHTASLIHDDVVDGADQRRGVPTLNRQFGAQAATQAGDFLLACAMKYLKHYKGTGINELLAQVSVEMSSGELDQQAARYRLAGCSLERWLAQAHQKTACFLSACCRCGGMAGGADEAAQTALAAYGEALGIAFQLRDDLLDYGGGGQFGKRAGQDLRSGAMAAPILFALEAEMPEELRLLLERREKTEKEIGRLVRFIADCGALERTQSLAARYSEEAVRALLPLPPCGERDALAELARSLAIRTK